MDIYGKKIVPLIYNNIYRFQEGLIKVSKSHRSGSQKWGFIDKTGRVIVPLIYDDVQFFHNGFAKVNIDSDWFYIDKTGREFRER